MKWILLFISVLFSLSLVDARAQRPEQNDFVDTNNNDGVVEMQINEPQQDNQLPQTDPPNQPEAVVVTDIPPETYQEQPVANENQGGVVPEPNNQQEGVVPEPNNQQEEVAVETNSQPEVVANQPVDIFPDQEIDWGVPDTKTNDMAGDPNIVDQVQQVPVQETVQENAENQQPVASEGQQQGDQYGVESNDHDEGRGAHEALTLEDREKQAREHAERQKAEQDELDFLQPKIKFNVHDSRARNAAEFMKKRQFGPIDIEEMIHGGHHGVHDEEAEGKKNVQAGDMEAVAFGDVGKKKDVKPDSTLDPEEMMHAGQGGHGHGHGHEPEVKDAPEGDIGINVEKIIRGEDYGKEEAAKPGKKVSYRDIIDLGLSEEALKGIDLSQLLEQEKREYESYRKETENEDTDSDGDSNEWEQRSLNLRQQYLNKLYAKIRVLEMPDLEHAEWDLGEDEAKARGESTDEDKQFDEYMEMWGSTMPKGKRKQGREVPNATNGGEKNQPEG